MPPAGKAPAALCRPQLFMAEGRYSACLFFLGAGHSISVKVFLLLLLFFPGTINEGFLYQTMQQARCVPEHTELRSAILSLGMGSF